MQSDVTSHPSSGLDRHPHRLDDDYHIRKYDTSSAVIADGCDWVFDEEDDEPIAGPLGGDSEEHSKESFSTLSAIVGSAERTAVTNGLEEEQEHEPQNMAFAAAIRWALRARNLDVGGGAGGGGGGGAEEIDGTDEGVGLGRDILVDRVDQEVNRARELIVEADRHVRLAESDVGRDLGSGLGIRSTSPRGGLERRIRRREKNNCRDRLLGERRPITAPPPLPLDTPIRPDTNPKDFIAAVVVDTVLNEVACALDSIALAILPLFQSARKMKKTSKGSVCPASAYKMSDVERKGLEVARSIVSSPYRKLLVSGVFKILLVHCGLRIKWTAAKALDRYGTDK
jgi:hypothetical protein